MKICHVFNLANNAYNIVKALRGKGYDADLILNSRDFGMAMPMWEDLDIDVDPYRFNIHEVLKQYDLPSWMKIWWYDISTPTAILQSLLSLFYIVKPYDLLQLHPPSPVYLQFSQKPYIIHEAGWIRDLVDGTESREKLARRAYSKAECIVMTNPDTYALLQKMRYRREVFIPFIIDPNRYKPLKVEKTEDLLFFHPARHVWDVKGNDRLIMAFKRFIDVGYRAKLRMVDWGWAEDVAKAKALVNGLDLSPYVEWVKPFSKPALIQAYNEADVVFDQFILGSGGTTLFEAMACETPVVIYLNSWNEKCFGEMPPIVNESTADGIFSAMKLLTDKGVRRGIGEAERRFIIRHNSPEIVADQHIKLYEELLE